MTRKHYTEIAKIIATHRPHMTEADQACLDDITRELAGCFKRDNDRFDRARFYAASGMEEYR